MQKSFSHHILLLSLKCVGLVFPHYTLFAHIICLFGCLLVYCSWLLSLSQKAALACWTPGPLIVRAGTTTVSVVMELRPRLLCDTKLMLCWVVCLLLWCSKVVKARAAKVENTKLVALYLSLCCVVLFHNCRSLSFSPRRHKINDWMGWSKIKK